jgi:hypothetical protein
VLAVGADDAWRWPMDEHQIRLITAHRGGVVVRNMTYSYEMDGVEPAVTTEEVRRDRRPRRQPASPAPRRELNQDL